MDKARIAVIDDDSVFVELMHDLLAAGEGYDVVSSLHWTGGFEFVKESRPDLVILDLMMGRQQTGWAVLDLLREDPQTAEIPIILCSAAAPVLSKWRAQLAERGAIETLAKPFDVDHMLAVIARLLHARSDSANELTRGRAVTKRPARIVARRSTPR